MRVFVQFGGLLSISILLTRQTWGKPIDNIADAQQAIVTAYAVQKPPLDTTWTYDVSPDARWPSYPRPQLRRSDWQSLNGIWQWQDYKRNGNFFGYNVTSLPKGAFDKQVLVPSCLESGLSGKCSFNPQPRRLMHKKVS